MSYNNEALHLFTDKNDTSHCIHFRFEDAIFATLFTSVTLIGALATDKAEYKI